MESLAETSTGRLRGAAAGGIYVFKGIPFAQPPVGALRWQPPQPGTPWAGVRDALAFGPCAIQSTIAGDVGELIGIATHETSEDCLYLNVWSPGLDEAKRPVLVWIHGGGNTVGAGSQPRVNGEHLARTGDVVVVTVNYRLGALGFLYAPEIGAGGNQALLDQTAALRWVRQEIAAFGGDPGNVTVFGQSAGGFDIAQLMAMPAAHGCFDRAVPMSGSLTTPVPAEAAHKTAAALANEVGGWQGLRDAPAETICRLQSQVPGARWAPTLDGETIDEDPAVVLAEGRFTRSPQRGSARGHPSQERSPQRGSARGYPSQENGMPLLIGHTRDESTLFTMLNPRLADLGRERLLELAGEHFGEAAEDAVACYEAERGAAGLPTTPAAVLAAISTDRMFRLPAIRTAECHLAHTSEVWMYRFDRPSPAHDGRLGACHSLDIPYVWGTYDLPAMRRFCGEDDGVGRLSKRVMAAYLAFARGGEPVVDGVAWPTYGTRDRSTLLFDDECQVAAAPFDASRQLWPS